MHKESKVSMEDQSQKIEESFEKFLAVACSIKTINDKYEGAVRAAATLLQAPAGQIATRLR